MKYVTLTATSLMTLASALDVGSVSWIGCMLYYRCAPLPSPMAVIACPYAALQCGKMSDSEWSDIASNLPQCNPPKCIPNSANDPTYIHFAMNHPEMFRALPDTQ